MNALTDRHSWYEDSVVYHVFPRTFCDALGEGIGNIEGILGKLDYLANMHVNTLYVQDIDDLLPNLDDEKEGKKERQVLKGLCQALKERDMHLLVDLPTACTSPAHPWFLRSLKRETPYTDYYLWRSGRGKTGQSAPDGRRTYGKSIWNTENRSDWYMHRLGKPILNWDSAEMRQAMLGLAKTRLSLGVDGFVLPAKDMHVARFATGKSDQTERDETYARLEAFVGELREVSPVTVVLDIGDENIRRAEVLPYADGVYQMPDVPQSVRGLRRPNFIKLKQRINLRQQGAYGHYMPALAYESATLPRALTWFAPECGDYRKEAACMMATAIYMLRGTPYVYQGQEIGLTDYPFKHFSEIEDERFAHFARLKVLSKIPFVNRALLKRYGRYACDNARTAMPWTALLPNAGFTAGTLRIPLNPAYIQVNVQADLEKQDGIITFYRRLMALRTDPEYVPVVRNGIYKEYYPHNKDLLVYSRSYKGVTYIVVCNLRCASVPFVLPDRVAFSDATLLLANYEMPAHLGAVTLRPYECMVYRLK